MVVFVLATEYYDVELKRTQSGEETDPRQYRYYDFNQLKRLLVPVIVCMVFTDLMVNLVYTKDNPSTSNIHRSRIPFLYVVQYPSQRTVFLSYLTIISVLLNTL